MALVCVGLAPFLHLRQPRRRLRLSIPRYPAGRPWANPPFFANFELTYASKKGPFESNQGHK
jgi:hypothetical protein